MQVLKPFLHNGKRYRRGDDAPTDLDKQATEQHKRLGMIGNAPAQADVGDSKGTRSTRRAAASPSQAKPARPASTKPVGPSETKPAGPSDTKPSGPDQVQQSLGPAGDGEDGQPLGSAAAVAADAQTQSPTPEGRTGAADAQQASSAGSAAD